MTSAKKPPRTPKSAAPGKPKQLAHMVIWVNDYIAGTRSMTLAERGAYIDLILFEWARGGALPNDHKLLAKLLGVSLRDFEGAWEGVAEKFERVPGGGLANPRCERERKTALEKRAKAAVKAKAGALEMWRKKRGEKRPDDAPSMGNGCSKHENTDAPSMKKDASSTDADAPSMNASNAPSSDDDAPSI